MAIHQPFSIQILNQLPHISDVRFGADGRHVIYLAAEGAHGSLYAHPLMGKPFRISGECDVHGGIGYGGGEFSLLRDMAVFADRSGSLYKTRIERGAKPTRISPPFGSPASPLISSDFRWFFYVFQDGDLDGLAIVPFDGSALPTQLVTGADFYMQPCWHPVQKIIAWVEWNHPYMPWDASRVKLGTLSGGAQINLQSEHLIAGGEGKSASYPCFSPDGRWLSYIVRNGDWDDLVIYDLKSHTHHTVVRGEGFHLRLPEWTQGLRAYAWKGDSRFIVYTRYARGRASLWVVEIRSRKSYPLNIHGIQWVTQVDSSPMSDAVVFLGSSPSQPRQICIQHNEKIEFLQLKPESGQEWKNIQPQEVAFQTADGSTAYAFLYMPYENCENQCPLVIHIHGGPTSAFTLSFSTDAHWFTSRGYAYAQLNYRGSSGYGYAYQEALRHQWGIVDVEDTYYLAKHLINQEVALPQKVVLIGSSAGGYTLLRALIRYPGFFKAGICSYPVSDLLADAQNTHKFERYYHRFLTGDLSKNRERFLERSPIHSIDRIRDPIALFHGDKDKVVSVEQTLQIYGKLKACGTPCELKIYEGEGHGFREPQNVEDFYQRIEHFLAKNLR